MELMRLMSSGEPTVPGGFTRSIRLLGSCQPGDLMARMHCEHGDTADGVRSSVMARSAALRPRTCETVAGFATKISEIACYHWVFAGGFLPSARVSLHDRLSIGVAYRPRTLQE